MGALKQLEVISQSRPVEAPAIRRRLATVEHLAEMLGRTPNAIRMLEKRGTIRRVENRERRVLFDLLEVFRALGLERALMGE
jgi:hypothetical protein